MPVTAIGFPTNVVILTVAVMAALATGSWFMLLQGLRRLSLPNGRSWLWAAAIALAALLIIRVMLAVYPPGETVLGTPYIVAFLVVGIFVGLLPLTLSPTFRQVVRSIPPSWIIGLHGIRVAGMLFLALLDMKLLPPEFALPAGYGDITVGVLALALIYRLETRRPVSRTLLIGWNMLGLLDLIVALITGSIFIGPFAAQLAASGVNVLYLNYVLIVPSFGVPLLAVLHFYSLYQTLSARATEMTSNPERAPQSPARVSFQTGQK